MSFFEERYWNLITRIVFGAKIGTQGRNTTELAEEMGVPDSVHAKGAFLHALEWAIEHTFVSHHTWLQAIPVALQPTETGCRLPKK